MLPKTNRLNLKKDFKWVASGKRIETPFFKLFWKNGENNWALVGIATSSKEFNKANLRNKARRVISFSIEQFYSSLPTNLNLVIMPKTKVLQTNQEELKEEFKKVLAHLK